MIRVTIDINGRVIHQSHAVRIDGEPGKMCVYKTDTGDMFPHHYDDGAIDCVVQLLQRDRKFNNHKRTNGKVGE